MPCLQPIFNTANSEFSNSYEKHLLPVCFVVSIVFDRHSDRTSYFRWTRSVRKQEEETQEAVHLLREIRHSADRSYPGMHKNEPSIKAAMALPKKEQMERFIQLKKDGIFQGETQITQNCLSNGNRKKPTRSTEKRGMLFYVQGVLLQRSNKKPDYSKLIKERKQHIWHRFNRKMWFVVPCVWGSSWVSALIYKHKKRCTSTADNGSLASQHPVVLDQCHLYRSQEPGQIDTLRSQFGVFSILFFLINNSITI